MRLDARVIKGKKPLTCIDVAKAKKFEGTKGYFSDSMGNFGDLGRGSISFGTLKIDKSEQGFHPYIEEESNNCFSHFLPKEWVSGVVLPHTIKSFEDLIHSLNGWITIQHKMSGSIFKGMYLGYHTSGDAQDPRYFIGISTTTFTLDQLADDFDYYNPITKSWEPLGLRG